MTDDVGRIVRYNLLKAFKVSQSKKPNFRRDVSIDVFRNVRKKTVYMGVMYV